MKIIPITIAKNEETWLARVLTPLVEVFGAAILADTGSTDSTIDEAVKIPGVHLMQYENLGPADVGKARGWAQEAAKELFGATHVFLVDADELYPRKYLRYIVDNMMPVDAMSGYTYGVECTELPNGECWVLGDTNNDNAIVGVSRQAIFSVDAKWRGEYPFESPDCFVPGHPSNHYFTSSYPDQCFYHLHQMMRSRHDDVVYMRKQKKYQFSLQDAPHIQPARFWLGSEKEYRDDGE